MPILRGRAALSHRGLPECGLYLVRIARPWRGSGRPGQLQINARKERSWSAPRRRRTPRDGPERPTSLNQPTLDRPPLWHVTSVTQASNGPWSGSKGAQNEVKC